MVLDEREPGAEGASPSHHQHQRWLPGLSLAGSPLRGAVNRALRLVSPERVVAVVGPERLATWEHELQELHLSNVVAPAGDRGSAPAILLAIHHILRLDPLARLVVIRPVEGTCDPEMLRYAVERVLMTASPVDERITLVAATPPSADPRHSFVMPGSATDGLTHGVASYLRPTRPSHAAALIARGGLWDTGVLIGDACALVRLYKRVLPRLAHAFRVALASDHDCRMWVRDYLFDVLPTLDFSADLLARAPERLRVLRLGRGRTLVARQPLRRSAA